MKKRTGNPLCGWCSTGQHDRCPGVVRNGDSSLVYCPCTVTVKCGRLRCTECFEDNPEHVGSDGHCLDKDRCQVRQDMSVKLVRKKMNLPEITIQSRKQEFKEFDMAVKKSTTKAAAEKKAAKPAAKKESAAPEKGIQFLVDQVKAKAGKDVEPAKLRVLLRALVKDGVIERGEGRWSFSGVNDPAVKAVIKAVKEGKLETETRSRAESAKKAAATRKANNAKKKAEEVEEELEDLEEELEDVDLEDAAEEVEEAEEALEDAIEEMDDEDSDDDDEDSDDED